MSTPRRIGPVTDFKLEARMNYASDSRKGADRQVDATFRAVISSHDYRQVMRLIARLEQWLQAGGPPTLVAGGVVPLTEMPGR